MPLKDLARKAATKWARDAYRKDPAKFRARALRYRAKIDPQVARAKRRLKRGLPLPTRPEPNTCENCGKDALLCGRGLHLDHDHVTGAFRGWLCGDCNTGIGKLGDTIAGLRRAITYLERVSQ